MEDISKIIGERLRNYRNKNKMSQEAVAELAGVHPTYIGQLERGEKNPTIESIYKIANALNLPLEELFANLITNDKMDNEIAVKSIFNVKFLSTIELSICSLGDLVFMFLVIKIPKINNSYFFKYKCIAAIIILLCYLF